MLFTVTLIAVCMRSLLLAGFTGRHGVQDPDARDRDGDPVVVAVGGHYRSQAVTKEDLLLHVVNVSFTAGHLATGPSP